MIGVAVPNLTGGYATMMPNHHITKPVLIGEVQGDGQFNVVWQTPGTVVAQEWSPYLPGSQRPDRRLAQADVLRQLQRQDRQVRRRQQVDAARLSRRGAGRAARPLLPSVRHENRMILLRVLLLLLLALLPVRRAARRTTRSPASPATTRTFATRVDALAVSGNPHAAPAHRGACRPARCSSARRQVAVDQARRDDADQRPHRRAGARPTATLKHVRVNNAVRRAIEAALGALTLFSADPATRMKAADGGVRAARRRRAAGARPRAGARKQDPAVRARDASRRALRPCSPRGTRPSADRLAAIDVLRARGDLDARNLLASLTGQPPRSPRPRAARSPRSTAMQQLWALAQGVFYGLSLGSVLLLAAAGLAITFGVMGVINMAHGEMVMLGAYTTFVVQQVDRAPMRPALVRRQPADRGAAGLHRRRRRRHRDRALPDPLPLRPAAGDAARHLGPVAGAAAGGAQHLRRQQPRCRHARLDERRVAAGRADPHLQPARTSSCSRSWCWRR